MPGPVQLGFFFLIYLSVFAGVYIYFVSPFLFSLNYLCMDISVRNHSKVPFLL